jgi:hypothetical protein
VKSETGGFGALERAAIGVRLPPELDSSLYRHVPTRELILEELEFSFGSTALLADMHVPSIRFGFASAESRLISSRTRYSRYDKGFGEDGAMFTGTPSSLLL